ncbi:MAG: hypothetical protein ABSD29_17075 [Verrucomicrobiota bacterium]|jgi:hypothetical protein
MKLWPFIASVLLLSGCSPSTQTSTPHTTALTAAQATTLARQLANDEAFARYRCRPFHDGQAAQFEQGRWVWTGLKGAGQLDLDATVMLAADGSTNSVDLKVLDSRPSLPLLRR